MSATAAMGAIALHLLLLSALSLGTSASKTPRPRAGEWSLRVPYTDERSISTVIYIDPTVISQNTAIPAPRPIHLLKPVVLLAPHLVRLSTAELPFPGEIGDRESKSTKSILEVDGPEQAKLFDRYVNQIAERIERDWVRPSTPPAGKSIWAAMTPSARPAHPGAAAAGSRKDATAARQHLFKCRVQILQSRVGAVLEVTLLECDVSPQWQQSLVNAIDAASPLPSPPNAGVFARSLVLNFTSAASLPERAARTRVADMPR